jgi:Arc/MetJ-type ribon-helix-helix transcriptional regulator
VRLPDRLVGEFDRLFEAGAFDSRSQAVRSGMEAMVGGAPARRREDVDRQYRDAGARVPETDAELSDACRLAVDAIHDEPWERWW